jgi:hypothetical protein
MKRIFAPLTARRYDYGMCAGIAVEVLFVLLLSAAGFVLCLAATIL